MIDFKEHIILDNINSWPNEVLEIIKTNENSIKGFFQEEYRINKLAREDLSIQFNRPKNIHQDSWRTAIEKVENILKEHLIIGIHATNLLKDEIEDIIENGLKPLSKEFSQQRIERVYKKGLISKELKNQLTNKKELVANNRKGKIFVFHCLTTLKDEWGLNKLLGFWGGEAMYTYLKNTEELKKIGIPCIVFTSIKIKELDIYPKLSKRMMSYYFNNNYYPHDTDSIIEKKLNVLKVIKRDEKLFEDLTQIQNWSKQLK
ncbi:hypothetical protein [Tenacibaculum sp.]|uniref:hypothetical protein n=1 Tax=Tenacibaculum sp. TaxID=1906242 RepID=UPI003D0A8E7B